MEKEIGTSTMVSFSKPVAEPSESTLPAKHKHFLNPKLTSEDNVHEEAVKCCKHEALTNPGLKTSQKKNTSMSQQTSLAFTHAQASHTAPTTSQMASCYKSSPRNQWQASVEEDDEVVPVHCHAGPPKNPNAIIEAADGSDDMDVNDVPDLVDDDEDEEEKQEETDEQELSNFFINKNSQLLINCINLEQLQKDWQSAIYTFYKPELAISYVDGH